MQGSKCNLIHAAELTVTKINTYLCTIQYNGFRCISLSSFLLKTLEKIIDRHIRSKIQASPTPLHGNQQHAYMEGKSTETSLHNLVTRVERSLTNKEYALWCFFDVEGVFDKATPESIEESLDREGITDQVSSGIRNMLRHRSITAELGGETHTVRTNWRLPPGSCLSPLLWCY